MMALIGFLVLMALSSAQGLFGLFPLVVGAGAIWIAIKWAPFTIHFAAAA